MKATISQQEQQEREDRSCVQCKYSGPDICMVIFPDIGIVPVPVTNCESSDVQIRMIEIAAPEGETQRYIKNRNMLLFPCDRVFLAACQGEHFEKREDQCPSP